MNFFGELPNKIISKIDMSKTDTSKDQDNNNQNLLTKDKTGNNAFRKISVSAFIYCVGAPLSAKRKSLA